jgi:hypothetical protein
MAMEVEADIRDLKRRVGEIEDLIRIPDRAGQGRP